MKRVVAVASVTEDAAAINESHNSVLGKTLFAVDAPDGEHDMEDVVSQESQYCLGVTAPPILCVVYSMRKKCTLLTPNQIILTTIIHVVVMCRRNT